MNPITLKNNILFILLQQIFPNKFILTYLNMGSYNVFGTTAPKQLTNTSRFSYSADKKAFNKSSACLLLF